MTFWQDARPATPRLRRRTRPRRRRGRARFGIAIAFAIAVVALALVAPDALGRGNGGAPAPGGSERVALRPRRVPMRWSRTLPAWPAAMVRDGDAAIVVGGDRVSAVAIADGAVGWQEQVGRVDDRFAVRGETVLLATGSGFVALDRSTGATRWSVRSPERPGPVALVGAASGPGVAIGSTARGGLVGIDPATGRARWSVRVTGYVRSPFAVDHRAGVVAGVWQADRDHTVLRLIDASTGETRWERPIGLMAGAPAFAGGAVVVSSGGNGRDAAIEAFALQDGIPRWRTPVAAPSQPDLVPVVDGAHLTAVDQAGNVTRVRVRDGARVWRARTGALTTYARPQRVGDAVVVWNETGELLTLDRASGRLRARRRVAGIPVGLVVGDGTVVVAQRLLRGPPLQAFGAAAVAAPARRTG